MKCLEENTGSTLFDIILVILFGNISLRQEKQKQNLEICPQARGTRAKIDK